MEKKKILPVKSDVVFRLFFADERNQEDLICLLKAILKLPDDDYNEIEIADPHLLPEYADDKMAIIDVKLYTKSRKVIHIEIQLKVTPEMKKRIVFYVSKLVTEQIGEGDDYEEIKKVASIIITDKRLIADSPRYHHRFTLFDCDAGVEFSDLIEVHALELNKLPEIPDGTDLYDWAKFIAADSEEELAMITERNPQMEKVVVKLRRLSADERARDLYERREKGRRDHASIIKFERQEGREEGLREGLREGRQEGRQEGLQEGLQKGKLDMAKNLIGLGVPVDKIMEAANLTREEVEALRP